MDHPHPAGDGSPGHSPVGLAMVLPCEAGLGMPAVGARRNRLWTFGAKDTVRTGRPQTPAAYTPLLAHWTRPGWGDYAGLFPLPPFWKVGADPVVLGG